MSFRKINDTFEAEDLSLDLNEYWNLRELHETEEEEYFSSVQSDPFNQKKNKTSHTIYYPPEELTEEQTKKLNTENELVEAQDMEVSLDGEIVAIENELLFTYHMDVYRLETDQIAFNLDAPEFLLRPRQKYLLRKLLELKKHKEIKNPPEEKKEPQVETKEPPKSTFRKVIGSILDVGKKLVDGVDDAWNATKGAVPETLVDLLNPFFVGIAGGIINAAEGILGARRAYKAYKNKETSERDAKIATGILSSFLGATGTGLAISLIVKGCGIAILGSTVVPALIPACATLIYTAILLRKSYTFHCAKRAEHEAKEAYENALSKHQSSINELKETISNLHSQKNALRKEITPILIKVSENQALTKTENEIYGQYKILNKTIDHCDRTYRHIHNEINTLKQNYEDCREKRLKAERKVAMNVLEVSASVTVLTGIILGASLIFGSAFTFGIPTIIILVGIGIAVAAKIFEKVDEKYDHKITKGIRDAFTSVYDYVFSPNKTPTPTEALNSSSTTNIFKAGIQPKWSLLSNETTSLLHDDELQEKYASFKPIIQKNKHPLGKNSKQAFPRIENYYPLSKKR